jgi:hypothetical protein
LPAAYPTECENADVPSGSVCDVIQSNVEISYRSASGEVTSEDEQDMKDLLIETIMNQALAGAFEDLGSVESVEVDDGSSDGNGNSENDGMSIIPFVIAVIAAVAIFFAACYYCARRKNASGDEHAKRENVEDTSDDEPSDGEQIARGGVSDVDEKKHTQAEIPASTEASAVPQAEPGSWFGWTSNDEHPEVEGKTADSKKGEQSSSVAGWSKASAPIDEEC